MWAFDRRAHRDAHSIVASDVRLDRSIGLSRVVDVRLAVERERGILLQRRMLTPYFSTRYDASRRRAAGFTTFLS